ncbi:nucleoside hydrolase-like domain-containing protein [Halolactibacillus sp. JCM 19043]|uniref:nucleoside hydrolase-like domain-containing protein n=1 Tax=Halolactibacillus sp. JCM 19043 TaxID=1460638 RepID=UPI0012E17B24|nr:nucleoside hydrolase-like domain-containing protein [Halolactibacillus sp. JCM 19043]
MSTNIKHRTVIMLDPELDDLNTIVRYLLYSNHFHTEGIIYSSSRYHWREMDKVHDF